MFTTRDVRVGDDSTGTQNLPLLVLDLILGDLAPATFTPVPFKGSGLEYENCVTPPSFQITCK
jgi:hypothetical protein